MERLNEATAKNESIRSDGGGYSCRINPWTLCLHWKQIRVVPTLSCSDNYGV